jgi:DNA repair photolyase
MDKTIVSANSNTSGAVAAKSAAQPEPLNAPPAMGSSKPSLRSLGLVVANGRVYRSTDKHTRLVCNFYVLSIISGTIRYYKGPVKQVHYVILAGRSTPLRIVGDLYDLKNWIAAGGGRLVIISQGDFKAFLDHRIGVDGIQRIDPNLNEVMLHGTHADNAGLLQPSDKIRFPHGEEECPYSDRELVTGDIKVLDLLGSLYQPTATGQDQTPHYGGYVAQLWVLSILGTAFKPILGFWPHILIVGAKESGKTTIAALLASCLGLEQRGINHLATLYRLTKTLANTILPVGLDEIQRVAKGHLPALINTLNLAYNFSYSTHGNGEKHYTLAAPAMMLGQDDPFDRDVALHAKMVILPVDGRWKNPQALQQLRKTRQKAPLREWITFACAYAKKHNLPEEVQTKAAELIASLGEAGERTDEVDRTAANYAILLVTAEAAKEFGLTLDLKAIRHLVEDLFRRHVTGGDSGEATGSIGHQFIRDLVDQLQRHGGRDFPNTILDDQLIFNLKSAMDVLGRRGVVYDVQSTKGMAEQLRRVGADFKLAYINRVRTRCCVLPLKLIETLGLDISELAQDGPPQNGSGTAAAVTQSPAPQAVNPNGTLGTLQTVPAPSPAKATGAPLVVAPARNAQLIAQAAAAKSGDLLQLPGMSCPVRKWTMQTGIKATAEFEKKGLASFAVNPGLRCSHDCSYCSQRGMTFRHKFFKQTGLAPSQRGYAIIDPDAVARVAHDAKHMRKRGRVQISTTVDSWSPEAQALGLGRRCLEAILAQPGWEVRILTKNAAVVNDFDLIKKHSDRVLVGLSVTATPAKEFVMKIIEPNASTISERMEALREANRQGLRTYSMYCPMLPGISDDPADIADLVAFSREINAEEIFVENVNPRGNALPETSLALRQAGFYNEALMIDGVRHKAPWSDYVVRLVDNAQSAVRKEYGDCKKLRFLLYANDLTPADRKRIQDPDRCIRWLIKPPPAPSTTPEG